MAQEFYSVDQVAAQLGLHVRTVRNYVHMVAGRDAMIDSHETKRRLEGAVPHATVRLLPAAGHLLPGLSAIVIDFLRGSNVAVPQG